MWVRPLRRKPSAPEPIPTFLSKEYLLKPDEQEKKANPRRFNRTHAALVMDAATLSPEFRSCESVEFRCSVPRENSFGLLQVFKTEFKTGTGPCGRFVMGLKVEVTPELLRITQVSASEDISELLERFRKGLEKHTRDAASIERHGFGSVMAMNPTERDFDHHLVDLENLATEITEKAGKREIKEFIYKMSDIHGRIVTTK